MAKKTTGDEKSMTERERERLAAMFGDDNIRQLEARWFKFMREGVIVEIHIRRWRAHVALSFADLGVPIKAQNELVRLGDKYLFPARFRKASDSLDAAARGYLAGHTSRTHWGQFLPAPDYAEVMAQLKEYQARYLDLARDINACYDDAVNETLAAYRDEAHRIYKRLKRLTTERDERLALAAEAQFVDEFVERIRALIPSKRDIVDSFGFEIELGYVPLPSLLSEDEAQADRVRARREAERRREQSAQELRDIKHEQKRRAKRMSMGIQEAALLKREEMLAEMNREVVETAKKQKQQLIDGFMRDIASGTRQLFYKAITDVLGAIKRNRKIHPRSVVQLKNVVEQLSGSAEWCSDNDIKRMRSVVQAQLTKISTGKHDVAEIQAVLEDIAVVVRSQLLDMGATPRSSGKTKLGVEGRGATAEINVRQARERLAIDEIEIEAEPERKARRGEL
jgi:hypothetical protein